MIIKEVFLLNNRDYHEISINRYKNTFYIECINCYTGMADIHHTIPRKDLQKFYDQLGELLNKN